MEKGKVSPSATPPRWRRRLVIGLMVVVGASIAGRAVLAKERQRGDAEQHAAGEPTRNPPPTSAEIMPQTTPPRDEGQERTGEAEPGAAERILPFLTEGGVAMLLGLALGIATRSVFRIALLLVAVTFIAIQFLAYKGYIAEVDWGGIATGLKNLVLNLPETTGLSAMLQYKLPSAGSLVLGYYLGLKRG